MDPQKYLIYVDMDGVLVDFVKGYLDLTGIDITGQMRSDRAFWNPIDRAGHKFWANLGWMDDGKHLWGHIEKYEPKILSAPSKKIDSRIGKEHWVLRELPGTQLILRSPENKKEFASPNSILIDDRPENIAWWQHSKGIGILHKNTNQTINDLIKLGI